MIAHRAAMDVVVDFKEAYLQEITSHGLVIFEV
jgi:hypothetical protein